MRNDGRQHTLFPNALSEAYAPTDDDLPPIFFDVRRRLRSGSMPETEREQCSCIVRDRGQEEQEEGH